MKMLEGVTVLDFSTVISGPYAGMYLADLGAKVIKIERPGQGDATRLYEPKQGGVSTYFACLNRNKKFISVDMKTEEGRDIILKLAAKADIVLENFRPGVMDRLGLGYEALSRVNPAIVYGCISGYGQYGPYANRPGYDAVAQAVGGLAFMTGRPEDPPTRVGASITDVGSGIAMCVGLLGAYYHARKTGEGQIVDVSLTDTAVSLCPQDYSCRFGGGDMPVRMGNMYRAWVPYGTYKAMDGYYIIGCGTDMHYKSFCEKVLNMPELAADERFLTHKLRVRHRSEIDAIINSWASDKKAEDICSMLRAAGVPFGLVNNARQVVENPQTVARHMVLEMDHPTAGRIRMINNPVRMNDEEFTSPSPVGEIGADNEEIFAGI